MASAISLLSEDVQCPICMDVLTDPVSTPCGHNYCQACITRCWDTSDVCKCPLCAKVFDERPDISVNTFIAKMVHLFRRQRSKEEYEAKTEAEVQQMITERQGKIQEFQRSVEFRRKDADGVMADSAQLFTLLKSCIERSQADLTALFEEKQKSTETKAEGFVEELHKEITQLEKRISELKHLSHPEGRLHLAQNITPNKTTAWSPTTDWTKVHVSQSSHVETVRRAVSQLNETLCQEMRTWLSGVELRGVQRYEVDVTVDPDTAHPILDLSEDEKQVSCGNEQKNLPDNPKRFSTCPNVLGRQSFCSGRFYYEVHVGGKTDWIIGVARESINRNDQSPTMSSNSGYWTIGASHRNQYVVLNYPWCYQLPVKEELHKVGVFVDYEEGLVSFYDVETGLNLYSFNRCNFTERLHPFFSQVSTHHRNSAPLIITPVNMDAALGEDEGDMLPPPSKRRK